MTDPTIRDLRIPQHLYRKLYAFYRQVTGRESPPPLAWLAEYTPERLAQVPGLGKKTVAELEGAMGTRGFRLKSTGEGSLKPRSRLFAGTRRDK